MKLKQLSIAVLTAATAMTSMTAVAESPFYATLEIVRSDLEIEGIDDTDTSFGIGVGYMINENFSIQAGYQDFGEISASAVGVSASAEADAFQLSILGGLPVSENAGVYAELGIDFWDGDLTASVSGVGSASAGDDGSDVYYGIGGYVMFSENVGATLEYQFHELDSDLGDVEIDTLGIGISVSF